MALVRHLLYLKGKQVWSVSPSTPLLEAIKLFDSKDIGALVVLDGDKLVGIVSERDVVRKTARAGSMDMKAPVKDYMTSGIFFVETTNTVEECMKLMTDKHIRHLPVLEKGKIIGVISINDLVKEIIADQESTIRSLENYIVGQEIQQ